MSGEDTFPAAPRRVECCDMWPDCNHSDQYDDQAAATMSECRNGEGCHRVVACDPGCAVGSRLLAEQLAAARDRITIPLAAFDQLVKVAMHVSLGRSAAFSQDHPYPDATARYGLGALDEHGLLDDYRHRHPEDGTP